MRCETCAKEITKEGGELRRPILRNRDGVYSEFTSLVMVRSQIDSTVAGVKQANAVITIPDNLIIGQLPGTAIKAHVCIRDFYAIVQANGTLTAGIGFLYYKDVFQRLHCVGMVNGLGVIVNSPLLLIVDSPVTDANPSDLGIFVVDFNQFTLGTATVVSIVINANIEVHYEQ